MANSFLIWMDKFFFSSNFVSTDFKIVKVFWFKDNLISKSKISKTVLLQTKKKNLRNRLNLNKYLC